MKEDLRKMVSLGKFYLIGSLLEKSLPFLFLPIYTNYLTPADYGVLSLVTILVAWSGKVVAAPVGNGITRNYHNPDLQSVQKEMIFSGWLFTFGQSIVFGACFVLFKDFISESYLGDIQYSKIIFLFAFVMLTQPLGTLMFSLLRIQSKAKLYVTGNFIIFSISALLQLLLLVYYELGLYAMVWGMLFTSIAKLILIFPFTIKNLSFKFNWMALKSILHFGYPLIIAAVVGVASRTLDRILINYYFDLAMVGLLALALKISSILNFSFSAPFKQTIVPIIYEKEVDKEGQLEFVKRMTTYVVAGIMFCGLSLAVFAKEIVTLVSSNPDFYDAWKVVPFLLFATANEGAQIMFGYGMAMAKKSFMISLTSIYVFIINAILLVTLTPLLGLIGAGIAVAGASIIRNVIKGYYSNKYYGQTYETRKLIIIVVLVVVAYIITYQLNNELLIYAIPFKLLVVILYPVVIWKSNLISKADKKSILAMVNRVTKGGIKSIFNIH